MQGRPLKIAVAGGTGRVGHHIVEVLKSGGHDVVLMSRSTGVDVISGNGLGKASPFSTSTLSTKIFPRQI